MKKNNYKYIIATAIALIAFQNMYANYAPIIQPGAPGENSKILDPKNSWEDPSSYDTQAKKLVSMFIDNFTQFENDVDENVKSSGPISI